MASAMGTARQEKGAEDEGGEREVMRLPLLVVSRQKEKEEDQRGQFREEDLILRARFGGKRGQRLRRRENERGRGWL